MVDALLGFLEFALGAVFVFVCAGAIMAFLGLSQGEVISSEVGFRFSFTLICS